MQPQSNETKDKERINLTLAIKNSSPFFAGDVSRQVNDGTPA